MEAADEYARALAQSPPLALQAIKELVVRSQSMTLDEGIRLETTIFELLKTTEDAKEGPKAFAEKRAPQMARQIGPAQRTAGDIHGSV